MRGVSRHLALVALLFAPSATAGQSEVRLVWEVGAVDGAEHETWSRIAAAGISDRWVVAFDQHGYELRVFDRAGKYHRTLGGAGAGPGEFSGSIVVRAIRGDTLVVQQVDGRISSFLLSTGHHLDSRNALAASVPYVIDSRRVGSTTYHVTRAWGGLGGMAARVYRERDGARSLDTLMVLSTLHLTYRSARERNYVMTLPMARTGPEAVVLFRGDASLLLLNGIEGTLTTIRLTEEGFDTISAVQLPARGGRVTRDQERRLRDFVEQWRDVMRWDELTVPDRITAWDRMILDGEEGVWLRRKSLLDDDPEGWIRMRHDRPGVFEPFAFTGGVRVLAVHGDHVVAVRKGALDEEYLQLYRVDAEVR